MFFWCISYGVLCMLWQHFVYRLFFSHRSSDCCLAVPSYSWHYFWFIFLLSFVKAVLLCLLCNFMCCELCGLWVCWLQSSSQSEMMEFGEPSCSHGGVYVIDHYVVMVLHWNTMSLTYIKIRCLFQGQLLNYTSHLSRISKTYVNMVRCQGNCGVLYVGTSYRRLMSTPR